MGKFLTSTVLVFSASILYSWGQIKKQFTVESPEACQAVELHMKAKVGNCFIRPSQATDLLNIYSNQDLEEYGHSFKKEMKGYSFSSLCSHPFLFQHRSLQKILY